MTRLSRRDLLRAGSALSLHAGAALSALGAEAPVRAAEDGGRPAAFGLQIGDPSPHAVVIAALSDRPARLVATWVAEEDGRAPVDVAGGLALAATDFSARVELRGLPPDRHVVVSARFEDARTGALSEPLVGRLRTAPATRRDVRLAWSGDLCGQGWGIDVDRGGYRLLDIIRARDPDAFLFCGDRIYADGLLEPARRLPDGTWWTNLVTDATDHVAETLDDFRGRYRYHWLDPAYRRFCAALPVIHQWDDHEVVDNWAPAGWLRDDRYVVRDVHTLALRARQAWGEHTPLRPFAADWARMYRHVPYGPLADVFVLDGRSYRSPDNSNRAAIPRPDAALFGRPQLAWLKRQLVRSSGLWKIILTAQPLTMLVRAGAEDFDGVAGGPGAPLGREHELEDLLRFLKKHDLTNVVFVSTDVHHSAAIHLHPDRGYGLDFLPVWELVTGPLHAGAFGPGELDPTFGPELRFVRAPPPEAQGVGPTSSYMHFGELTISGATGALSARFFDGEGSLLHTEVMAPSLPR